jgi:transcriptional regulator with XRE-family HTH domain
MSGRCHGAKLTISDILWGIRIAQGGLVAIQSNSQRLKDIRLQHAWSQEQLAEISGVSVRTVQRLEKGGRGSLETMRALAAAMGVLPSALVEPIGCRGQTNASTVVRRVTPLTVLADISLTVQQHLALGFSLVETGDPACVGLRAGNTYLILATREFMAGDFQRASVDLLTGRTVHYIYVESVDAARKRLCPQSLIIDQATTRGGTLEALVEHDGQYMILAEKVAA